VFTRYWLHNAGPAPLGYLPVSVHITQLAPNRLRVTVAASTRDARGSVELDVPAGLRATAHDPLVHDLVHDLAYDLAYDLAPGEHADFELAVHPDEGAAPGTYYVAARIRDELGQLLEDAVPVTVGAPTAEPLRAELAPDHVRVTNNARSEIRGEAQLVSPYGTWGAPGDEIAVTPRARGFAIPPGATVELPYDVLRAPGARPGGDGGDGGEWWVLARVTAFGAVHYTEAVALTAGEPCRSTG
jgi:hypothetical protein